MLWFDGGGGEEAVWRRKEARATEMESFFLSILVVVCLDKSPFIALIRLKPIYLDLKLLFLCLCLCLLSLSGKLEKIWGWASHPKVASKLSKYIFCCLVTSFYCLPFTFFFVSSRGLICSRDASLCQPSYVFSSSFVVPCSAERCCVLESFAHLSPSSL